MKRLLLLLPLALIGTANATKRDSTSLKTNQVPSEVISNSMVTTKKDLSNATLDKKADEKIVEQIDYNREEYLQSMQGALAEETQQK
jgi:hypothetical protein